MIKLCLDGRQDQYVRRVEYVYRQEHELARVLADTQ